MYLELGCYPARFQIYKLKLNFLYYILNQKEDSLIFKFFEAQNKNSIKGDWVSGVKIIMTKLGLTLSFGEIKGMKKTQFKSDVENKVNAAAFEYLKRKIKKKGKEINYGSKLCMQNYLQPNGVLNLQEQRTIFNFRVRANNLNYNTPSNKVAQLCLCEEELTNNHLYSCDILNPNEKAYDYSKLFDGTLYEQKIIINVLMINQDKVEQLKSTPGTMD